MIILAPRGGHCLKLRAVVGGKQILPIHALGLRLEPKVGGMVRRGDLGCLGVDLC